MKTQTTGFLSWLRYVALVALVALGLATILATGGGGGGGGSGGGLPPAPPPPDTTTFVFGSDVPEDQRQLIRDGIGFGHQYFLSHLGVIVEGDNIVHAFADLELHVDTYLEFYNLPESERDEVRSWLQKVDTAGFGVIFIYTGSDDWTRFNRELRIGIVLHEYVHVLQNDLAGPGTDPSGDPVPRIGPAWLIEGVATYLRMLMFVELGFEKDFDNLIEFIQQQARNVSALLSSYETYAVFQPARPGGAQVLAALAVKFLTDLAGLASLVDFYRGIGDGGSWQQAFQTAFGMSIDAFYPQFEEHRSINFPPLP